MSGKKLYLLLGIFLLISFASAGVCPNGTGTNCYYVTPTGSGTGNGANWANAYAGLPSDGIDPSASWATSTNLARGATYYIAAGSYTHYAFDTAESGTQWIRIIKATSSNSANVTGWQSSFAGQASFGAMYMRRDYYEIDGQYRNETNWSDSNAYGFKITNSINSWPINYGPGGDHLRFKYLDVGQGSGNSYTSGLGSTYGFYFVDQDTTSCPSCPASLNDFYIGYSRIHNVGVALRLQRADDGIVEFNYFGPTWAKEIIRGDASVNNWTIRNNKFVNGCQDVPDDDTANGCTADIGVWDGSSFDDWNVYGNLFWNNGGLVVPHSDGLIRAGGDTTRGMSYANNWKVYNNVIAGIRGSQTSIVLDGSNSRAYNNIWYDNSGSTGCLQESACVNGCSLDCTNNLVATSSPFVNYAAGDFNLLSTSPARNAGKQLTGVSGFDNVDGNANIRGSDGAWDIGSYEFSAPAVCTNCRYVRQGATGTNNGSDWTNAYTTLPATLTRGFTYYIADGTYSGYDFGDAVSGTQYITVKKATTSSHGTDTGWVPTYGDGQALFNGQIGFSTSNYIFDGVTGGGPGSWNSSFGFKIVETGDATPIIIVGQGSTANNIAVKHVDLQGKGSSSNSGGSISNDALAIYGDTNTTLSYAWMHGIGRCPFFFSGNVDTLMEYTYIQSYLSTSTSTHGEVMSSGQGFTGDTTFRYNLVTDIQSTGGLMWDDSSNPSAHFYVYGNVFYKPAGATWGEANGVIGGWSGGNGEQYRNVWVYNNAFINIDQQSLSTFPNVFSGNRAFNNIFYNSQTPSFSLYAQHGYNYFINSGSPSDNNGVVNNTAGNIFYDLANLDFRLTSPTPTGDTTLGPLFANDPLGQIRGSDGVYDRGAYEFNIGGLILVNGLCSSTLNVCTNGSLNNIADNATHYLWNCNGLNGGTTASCSQVIPTSAPSITTQPVSVSTYTGLSASFSVAASGNPSVSYQWQKLNGATWTNVGTNSASFTTASLTLSDSGSQYRVNVSSSLGSVLSSVVTLTVTTAPPVPVNGLVAYYNFDETSGNIANDAISNNDFTLFNSPVFTANGKINNGLTFNGANQYGSAGDVLDLTTHTLSAWINSTLPTGFHSIVVKRGNYGIELNGATLQYGIGNGGNDWTSFISTTITPGMHNVVATYDGSNMRIYVDGVQVSSAAAASTGNSPNPLLLGSWDTTSEYFNGVMDEVRIYNRALNTSEITALYNYGGTTIVDTFNYHPSDNNPQNKVISPIETSTYMNSYFTGSVSLTEALYTLTLLQSGGSYINLSSTGCNVTPWLCWASN